MTKDSIGPLGGIRILVLFAIKPSVEAEVGSRKEEYLGTVTT
jgi:hypothetical protein